MTDEEKRAKLEERRLGSEISKEVSKLNFKNDQKINQKECMRITIFNIVIISSKMLTVGITNIFLKTRNHP